MADDANGTNPDDADNVFIYTAGSIVPDDVVRVRVHPSITVIPREAFKYQNKLKEVDLPEGLLEIGEKAFRDCYSLKRIAIPSTVTVIRDSAFIWCKKLEAVELSEGLLEIGEMAFKCTSLKRMAIPSTVTRIGDLAFYICYQLEEVELPDGLLEIREDAFNSCRSLKRINLPTTIRNIGKRAFSATPLLSIKLPEELETVEAYAFSRGGLFTFRIPPLITRIPKGMVQHAESLFSVELSESVSYLESCAFAVCSSLRNLAIPPKTGIENNCYVFLHCTDLRQLFGTYKHIINALKHRFDNLPIHKMIYYQSYESVSVDQLNDATNIRSGQRRSLRSKLDPTGKQQDCLGMTPLHILTCSTVQNLELYKALIDKYPETLITEDRWGALPILYAVWGVAPSEIVQYLVERYQSIYPEYELNWTKMVETLGRGNVQKSTIQNLVDLQKDSFPEQFIDWDTAVEACTSSTRVSAKSLSNIVQLSVSKRVGAIGLKQWRDEIMGKLTKEIPDDDVSDSDSDIEDDDILDRKREFFAEFHAMLVHYETEYHNVKEATSIVELALWRHKMNDNSQGKKNRRMRKKMKIEDADVRVQCRISCGADIVIQHMLPYLLPRPVVYTDKIQHNTTIDSSSESVDESDDESIDESDDESESDNIPLSLLGFV